MRAPTLARNDRYRIASHPSMSTIFDEATITVALLGNPNTGKSTLFSALVGAAQRIGNYPGVTVEKTVGETQIGRASCRESV